MVDKIRPCGMTLSRPSRIAWKAESTVLQRPRRALWIDLQRVTVAYQGVWSVAARMGVTRKPKVSDAAE